MHRPLPQKAGLPSPARSTIVHAPRSRPWTGSSSDVPMRASRGPPPARKLDLELQLLQALLGAMGKQLPPVSSAPQLLGSLVDKATKGFQPPPEGFPRGPSGDQGLSLVRDPLGFLTKLQAQYGDVVGFVLAGERVVMVADPMVAKEVLVERPDVFIKEGTAFFPGSKLAGEGLLVSDGEVWRRQRQLSNPAFRKAAVDSYANAMSTVTEEVLGNLWRQGGLRDVYQDYNELTLQIVATALFGSDIRGPRARVITSKIATAFDFFGRRAATGFAIPEWLPTPDNVQYNAAVQQLDEVVYDLIRSRRAELVTLEAKGKLSPPRDLLERLMFARDEQGMGMGDQALRDELMTLMVAGQETSAILLGWCCFELASHPEVQERCARELDLHFPDGRMPTAADLGSDGLRLLESVILETMRVLPPAYMVGRCANQDIFLGGGATYRLPKGTTVLVSPYLMHKDPRIWDRAASFVGDRWVPILEGRPSFPKPSALNSSFSAFSTAAAQADRTVPTYSYLGDSMRNPPASSSPAARSPGAPSSSSSVASSPTVGSLIPPAAPTPTSATAVALRNMGPNGAYLPFGAGPRNCIGTGFAMLEVTLVLSWILRRYKLSLPRGPGAVPIRPQPLITLRPGPVELNLSPRRKQGPTPQ